MRDMFCESVNNPRAVAVIVTPSAIIPPFIVRSEKIKTRRTLFMVLICYAKLNEINRNPLNISP